MGENSQRLSFRTNGSRVIDNNSRPIHVYTNRVYNNLNQLARDIDVNVELC